MRTCKECGREFPVESFPVRPNGKGNRYPIYRCHGCEAQRQRERRRTHRYCPGCHNYRPARAFVIKGKGVRCDECRSRPDPVLQQKTKGGRKRAEYEQRIINARKDYDYARRTLHWTRERAIEWVATGYGTEVRTVERWVADQAREAA